MKKLIVSMMAVYFLAAVSGPVWADNTTPAETPAVKTMKHKMVKHPKKKKMMKRKKAAQTSTTPTAK